MMPHQDEKEKVDAIIAGMHDGMVSDFIVVDMIVHKKTTSTLCLTTVKNEDKLEFSKIHEAIKANFNNNFDEVRKKWGGGVMASKSQMKTKASERLIALEAAHQLT